MIIKLPVLANYAGGYRLEYDGKYITLFGKDKGYVVFKYSNEDQPDEYEEMVLVSCVAECREARPEIITFDKEFIYIDTGEFAPFREEYYRLQWSMGTFSEATPISSLRKCESEIKEIEEILQRRPWNRPLAVEEFADAVICLLDSAGRVNIDFRDICDAMAEKNAVNQKRKWSKNPDNSYSHIKEVKRPDTSNFSEDLITAMAESEQAGDDPNERSWDGQLGVLISRSTAIDLLLEINKHR